MKNEAGESLVHVKRKQKQITENVVILKLLNELREARKETAIYKGLCKLTELNYLASGLQNLFFVERAEFSRNRLSERSYSNIEDNAEFRLEIEVPLPFEIRYPIIDAGPLETSLSLYTSVH